MREAPEAEAAAEDDADDEAVSFMALAAKCAPLDTITRGEPFANDEDANDDDDDADDDAAVKADGADSDSGADDAADWASLSRIGATAAVPLRAPPMDATRSDHARSDRAAASAAALAWTAMPTLSAASVAVGDERDDADDEAAAVLVPNEAAAGEAEKATAVEAFED